MGEQQKKQFHLQLDQQMKAQKMALTQQYNEQLMSLRMQADSQKAALEQQAMHLTMEYEQRKAEETMYRQQYEIQKQQSDMASRHLQECGAVGSPARPHRQPDYVAYSHAPPMATQHNGFPTHTIPVPAPHMGTVGAGGTLTPTLPASTAPPTRSRGPPTATTTYSPSTPTTSP